MSDPLLRKLTDEELDEQLSRALMRFRRDSKEQPYAMKLLKEWRRRFEQEYYRNWDPTARLEHKRRQQRYW